MKNKTAQFNAELEGKVLALCKIHNQEAKTRLGVDRKECIYLATDISAEISKLCEKYQISGTEFSHSIKGICRWNNHEAKLEKYLILDLYKFIEKVKLD